MAAEIVGGVAVLGLDDDGEFERQALQHALALARRGDGGLGIVHAMLFTERVELVLGIEGLQHLHAVKAVRDQTLEVVVVLAQQPYIIIGAGDDQLFFIACRVFSQYAQQRVGKHLGALEVLDDL